MSGEENELGLEKPVGAAAALAREIPVYQDLLQPAARETGKALAVVGRAVNLALVPVRGLVWGGEQVERWVTECVTKKLANVPEEKITSPDISIAGPVLEALRFNGNNAVLSEMFASLLAGAMNEDTKETAHPIFVEKIKSMSTLDASLFKSIADSGSVPTVNIYQVTEGLPGTSQIVLFQSPKFHEIARSLSLAPTRMGPLVQASVENLSGLSLIRTFDDAYLTSAGPTEQYEFMLNNWPYVNAFKEMSSLGKYEFEPKRSYILLTGLGKQFSDLVFT